MSFTTHSPLGSAANGPHRAAPPGTWQPWKNHSFSASFRSTCWGCEDRKTQLAPVLRRASGDRQGLQVRQYETIQPRTVHFILDGTSFPGLSPAGDELEDVLSLPASLLVELGGTGVRCGLSLPQTAGSPNADLFLDDRSLTLADLLFRLADFDGATTRAAALNEGDVATGHYARVERDPDGSWLLKKALHAEKDQS